MSESTFTAKLCTEMRKHGALVHVNYNGGKFNVPGWPDRLVIWRGVHSHLEFKAPDGKLSKAQQLTIHDINAHGGNAYVIREFVPDGKFAHTGEIENETGKHLHCFVTAGGLLDWLQRDARVYVPKLER